VQLTSKQLTEAAQIAEQIESLEKRLEEIFRSGDAHKQNTENTENTVKPPVNKGITSAAKTSRMPKESRGTLRPAVVELLKKSKNPLKAADIYDALLSKGYVFTFRDPKKVLGIRLYKMAGIQPLGGGLFKAK
jgi:hypothetical protein